MLFLSLSFVVLGCLRMLPDHFRGNRMPTSRVISGRLVQQHHQCAAPNVGDMSNLVDEIYLRGM